MGALFLPLFSMVSLNHSEFIYFVCCLVHFLVKRISIDSLCSTHSFLGLDVAHHTCTVSHKVRGEYDDSPCSKVYRLKH
jgi:hypothetical protein